MPEKSRTSSDGLTASQAVRLLMAHRGMLHGYIASIAGDPNIVEDVFGELSVRVLEKHAQIYSAKAFTSWARSTARHLVFQQIDRLERKPVAMKRELLETLEGRWAHLEADEEPTPALSALRLCLEKLTPRARKLVALRYEKNRNGRQIAEAMQRPINTIYVAMSRIHTRLADCIRNQSLPEADA
ncbi:MAG: sigma-70 family RNA polymerase sigma factor [Phycisphaeraceae bacterium]|nr:sigma-70 family RNA polymerase sigma factor [Phycisphaeraceae bacterium]